MRAAKKTLDYRNLIERVQTDPVWFAERVLNLRQLKDEPALTIDPDQSWEIDIWQRELLEAVADVWRLKKGLPTRANHEGKTQFSVRSSHGPGKTFGMAMLAHWFNFSFPGRIIATAPKFSQVTTQLFPEFRKILRRSDTWYRDLIDVGEAKATWLDDPDWVMLADSASSPENIAGKHWQYLLVLVDEASGVPEALWPVIEGALSVGVMLILVMISNPTRLQGAFADSHLKHDLEQDYYRLHVNGNNSLRIQHSKAKRAYVDRMVRKYGHESPVVRIRCFGEFADADAQQLIALQWVEEAIGRKREGDGSLPRLRVSLDVADGGTAETVATAARIHYSFRRVEKIKRFNFKQKDATLRAADEAERLFLELGGKKAMDGGQDDFVVDALGAGAGTAGTLERRGYRVTYYKGGAGSSDHLRWRNKRAQSFYNLRDALRDGALDFDDKAFDDREDWEELRAQLCAIKSRAGQEKLEELEPKEQLLMRIELIDIADSIAMQYADVVGSPALGAAAERTQVLDFEPQVFRTTLWEGLDIER